MSWGGFKKRESRCQRSPRAAIWLYDRRRTGTITLEGRNHHNGIVVNMMMKPEDPAAPTTKIVDTVALEERLRACVCMVRKKVILGFVPLFKNTSLHVLVPS